MINPGEEVDADSKNAIGGLLEALIGGFRKENARLAETHKESPLVISALEAAKRKDFDSFFFSIIYPMEKLVRGIVGKATSNRVAEEIMIHSRFIDSHLSRLFEEIEGSACSADKSRCVIKKALGYYIDGTPIVFDNNQEYTYHHPKIILKTEGDVLAMIDALIDLRYGGYKKYLEQMTSIAQKVNNKAASA